MKTLVDLINRLNARGPFVILTPCISVIGNSSEEMLFGLIRARREQKRLVILYPFELPWKFRFPLTNRELFELSCPYRAEVKWPFFVVLRFALTMLYGPLRILSILLKKVLGQRAQLDGRFTHPCLGAGTLWKPSEEPAAFDWETVKAYRWKEALQEPLGAGLKPEKRERAHALRLQMGIPENAWFAAVHVRESGFYNDHAIGAFRNATIGNYLLAFQEITSRGGWVVRLGDQSMTPLPRLDMVVDYPHTRFKSDLMDLYFISECRIYIGMSSGILDTAFLFQRPVVLTNMTNMTFVYPRRPTDRGIPKYVFSKSKNRFLSLREQLEAPFDCQHFHTIGDDYSLHENSPAELRDVVVEGLDALSGEHEPLSQLQIDANQLRVAHGRKLLSDPILGNRYDDINNRYRIASRLESALGSLSRTFVAANWEACSRTADSLKKIA